MTMPERNTRTELPDPAGMTHAELEDFFRDIGKERFRATQVMKWIHQGLLTDFEGMTNLSKSLREHLAASAAISSPVPEAVTRSDDGTVKLLLRLHDRHAIESVVIPSDDHDTLCMSTQVGCAMGCRICRTAGIGFIRNLSAGEIVGQLLAVRRAMPETRITNLVFMGMGEPLANFESTVRAVKILTHPNGPGISWQRLTVSTSGVVPGIRKLGDEVRAKLAVSLNAVTDEQRDRIMPINKKYPIADLINALKDYPLPRRQRITIEYVLIDRFNDSEADARRLVKLLNPIRAKINLIPLNADDSCELRSPSPERVLRFQDVLMSRGLTAIIRKSRGQDVQAACGQLAAQYGAGS